MKNILKKATLIGVATLSGIALTACSGSSTTSTTSKLDKSKANKDATLRLAALDSLATLNPIRTTDVSDAEYIANVTLPLTEITPEGKIVGAGAESWEKSSDAKTWTFKIRDGLKYSTGEAITAEDYAYMMKAAKEDDKLQASNFTELVEKMEVVEGNKVAITFVNPQTAGDSIVGYTLFTPLEEAFYQKVGKENYGTSIETSLYSGAYTLTKWVKEQSFEMTRNENYFAKNDVLIKTIQRRVVPDAAARDQLFQNKEIDYMGVSADFVEKYQNEENKVEELQGATFYLMVGSKSEVTKNKNFRRALNMAIDKKTLSEQVIKVSKPTEALVGKQVVKTSEGKDFRDFAEASELNTPAYNVEEAKKELETAKKALGKDTLDVDYLAFESGNNKKVAEYIKQEVETNLPGVKINIRFLPQQSFRADRNAGNFDLCYGGWSPDYSDPMNIIELVRSNSTHNYTKLGTPELDKAIADADAINSVDKVSERYAAFAKAENIAIKKEAVLIPLFQNNTVTVTSGKVGGLFTPKVGGVALFKYSFIVE